MLRLSALPLAILVRPARDLDAKDVVALLDSERLKVAFDPREFVVAEAGGQVVGCARLKLLDDGAHELASVAVAPGLRGQRVGERLVRQALRGARGEVYALALKPVFFERQGFARVEALPDSLASKVSACGGSGFVPMALRHDAHVRLRYGAIAVERARAPEGACCELSEGGACADPTPPYSPEELAALPEGAYLALGTGNPVRAAELRPGEVLLDLGSGAGVDVLLAAQAVGPAGRALGVDFTPEMIARARENARRAGASNADFLEAPIERIPLPDASVDVVTSNCVVNLSDDKPAALREALRVLRPGGRFVVSDTLRMAGDAPMGRPSCDCTTGAMSADEWRARLAAAGFVDIDVAVEQSADCCGRSDLGAALIRARRP